MNPRSLLAGVTLLAFLTTQGICPAPALALRPSVEGVQSGLEEKLTPPADEWEQIGGELKNVSEILQRLLTHSELRPKDRKAFVRITTLTRALRNAKIAVDSLVSLFKETPPPIEKKKELISRAQMAVQEAWKALGAFDENHRGKFPNATEGFQNMLPTPRQTGLEEDALQRGWEAVRIGNSNQAAMWWGRWIQQNGLSSLHSNLKNQLEDLQRHSSKRRLEELFNALFAAQLVLSDPTQTGSMGVAEQDRWRERFVDLEDQAALLSGKVRGDQRLRIQARLDRIPEQQRLRYLRQAAGFRTPIKLEQAAHVAYAVSSRFEQGKRGLGPRAARKIRQLLEKRTGLTLTLSFRVLNVSLDRDLNPLPSADARFAFIKDELLGWSYHQLPRIATPYRTVHLPAQGAEIRIQSYEQAAHRTRRAVRQVLEEGLSKQWHVPVRLDGQLRVLTQSTQEQLQGLGSVEQRFRWLRDEVLIWSRVELMRRTRVGRALLRESSLPQGVPLEGWRRVRRQLEQGLAERGEKIRLDDRLLPVARPQPESIERLLKQLLPSDERLRADFQVRRAARRELMRRFTRPVSSDPAARGQEQAQIFAGLIGELEALRLSALRQGNGARPSGATRYATGRDFVRWTTSEAVYPQAQRILSAMSADPAWVSKGNGIPTRPMEEIRNTLGWLAQMSSRTKIWKPLSRKLETLWDAAGGRSAAGLEEDRVKNQLMAMAVFSQELSDSLFKLPAGDTPDLPGSIRSIFERLAGWKGFGKGRFSPKELLDLYEVNPALSLPTPRTRFLIAAAQFIFVELLDRHENSMPVHDAEEILEAVPPATINKLLFPDGQFPESSPLEAKEDRQAVLRFIEQARRLAGMAGLEEPLNDEVKKTLLDFQMEANASQRLTKLVEKLKNFQSGQRAQFIGALPWLPDQKKVSHLLLVAFTEDSELSRQVRSQLMAAFEDTRARSQYNLELTLKILLTWMPWKDSERVASHWAQIVQAWMSGGGTAESSRDLAEAAALGFFTGAVESSIQEFRERASPKKENHLLYRKIAESHSRLKSFYAARPSSDPFVIETAESALVLAGSASQVIDGSFEVLYAAIGQLLRPVSENLPSGEVLQPGTVEMAYRTSERLFSERLGEGIQPLERLIVLEQFIELEQAYGDYLTLREETLRGGEKESRFHYSQAQKLRRKRGNLIQKKWSEISLNTSAGLEEKEILAHEVGISYAALYALVKKYDPKFIPVTMAGNIAMSSWPSRSAVKNLRTGLGMFGIGFFERRHHTYSVTISKGNVMSSDEVALYGTSVLPTDIVAAVVVHSATGLEEKGNASAVTLESLVGTHPFPIRVFVGADQEEVYAPSVSGGTLYPKMRLLGKTVRQSAGNDLAAHLDEDLVYYLTTATPQQIHDRSSPESRDLLTALKRLIDEARVASSDMLVEAAVHHLAGPYGTKGTPSYANLISYVNRNLVGEGNPRKRLILPPIQGPEEITALNLWIVKEGDISQVFRVEVVLRNRPSVYLAVQIAKDRALATSALVEDYQAIVADYLRDPQFIMQPYELGMGLATAWNGEKVEFPVFVGEWLEGFHELHLYSQDQGRFAVWLDQRTERQTVLSETESDQIWKAIGWIQEIYYGRRFGRGPVSRWFVNGGDFVARKGPDGSWQIMMVWHRTVLPPLPREGGYRAPFAGLEEKEILAHEVGISYAALYALVKKYDPKFIPVTMAGEIAMSATAVSPSRSAVGNLKTGLRMFGIGLLERGRRTYSVTISKGNVMSSDQVALYGTSVLPTDIVAAVVVHSTAGLEEQRVAVLDESVQGPGVVVIGPEVLEMRAGLEEFVRKAPPGLVRRMVFYAVGAAWAARLKQVNPNVQVIAEEDLTGLAALLLSMPEAERVTVLGALALAQQLQRILPMSVYRLDAGAAFRLILAALGVPGNVLDQIDASGLEEIFAQARAA